MTAPSTYRTKPVTVEALQFTVENADDIYKMLSPSNATLQDTSPTTREGEILSTRLTITDKDGDEFVLSLGDWLVTCGDDYINIVSAEVFEELYVKV